MKDNNKRDLARVYFNDGINVLKKATQSDKLGQVEEAIRQYRLTQTKFTLSEKQPDITPDLKTSIQLQQLRIAQRIIELESLPKDNSYASNLRNTSEAAATTKRPPSNQQQTCEEEANSFVSKLEGTILCEKPNISWTDVAGLAAAKDRLQEAVIYPLMYPRLYTGLRTPSRGILLYGPPGTGKSFLAKATANEADHSTFISISASDVVSKWLGESEKLIRALFELASQRKPSIIFIDEIDSILTERSDSDSEAARRIKTEFLINLDGVGRSMEHVLVLAATNTPWALDPAVKRRFEQRIYIPLPELEARAYLIKHKLEGNDHSLTDEQIQNVAEMTEGYSGSDLSGLAREAAKLSLRRVKAAEYFVKFEEMYYPCDQNYEGAEKMKLRDIHPDKIAIPKITFADFQESIAKIRPTVSVADLVRYDEWTQEFGMDGAE